MSSTIDYYDDIVTCPECGEENEVQCISEYDVQDGETYNELVAGQVCSTCGAKLKFEE